MIEMDEMKGDVYKRQVHMSDIMEETIMGEKRKPATICIQSGWKPKNGEPRVLPIYQSTTFKYETSEQMGRLFDLEEDGYFYTRLANQMCIRDSS